MTIGVCAPYSGRARTGACRIRASTWIAASFTPPTSVFCTTTVCVRPACGVVPIAATTYPSRCSAAPDVGRQSGDAAPIPHRHCCPTPRHDGIVGQTAHQRRDAVRRRRQED
jgi:hypothetical protein